MMGFWQLGWLIAGTVEGNAHGFAPKVACDAPRSCRPALAPTTTVGFRTPLMCRRRMALAAVATFRSAWG
jgi:hypothetical protein